MGHCGAGRIRRCNHSGDRRHLQEGPMASDNPCNWIGFRHEDLAARINNAIFASYCCKDEGSTHRRVSQLCCCCHHAMERIMFVLRTNAAERKNETAEQ